MKPTIRACELCGDPMPGRRGHARFCSSACRAKYHRSIKPVPCTTAGCSGEFGHLGHCAGDGGFILPMVLSPGRYS